MAGQGDIIAVYSYSKLSQDDEANCWPSKDGQATKKPRVQF